MTATIILLLAFGFFLVIVEALVPGGVVGIIGGILLIIGVALSFIYYKMAVAGWIFAGTLVAVLAVMLVAFRFLPHSKFGRRMILSDAVEGHHREPALEEERMRLIGCEGKALTDLRPSGRGLIEGKKWDVVTSGGYIDKEGTFRVVRVEGPRIVVESTN